MKNIKLTYIPDSHGWLKIYLKAENAELAEAWFNSFWNHEATSQDAPEWIFENELAFCTTEEKLLRALENIYLALILNENAEAFKTAKGGAMPYAKAFAKEKFDGMERKDNSMRYGQQGHVYTMGDVYTNEEKSFNNGTCDV